MLSSQVMVPPQSEMEVESSPPFSDETMKRKETETWNSGGGL